MKLQFFAKVTILFQSIWNLAWVIKLRRSPALPNFVWTRWAVETPHGGQHIRVLWLLKVVGMGNYQPKYNVGKLRNGKRYEKYVAEPWIWNWGRSFEFRQQNLFETPPSGEITMTSYPVYNIKTSLSRKPCIQDEKLLWNAIRKSWSLFQNPSWKIAWSAPWRRNHDDVISGLK